MTTHINSAFARLHIGVGDLRWNTDSAPIVSAFEIDLGRGDICSIIGPSGSGKSTIFKSLVGWSDTLLGCSTIRSQASELQSQRVMLLPQQSEDLLLPWYCVGKNWTLAAEVGGFQLSQVQAERLAKTLGLQETDMLALPKQLSGGEQRRAALGMALLRGAALLLLDEPLTGLDPDVRVRVLDLLHHAVRRPEALGFPCHVGCAILIDHGVADVAAISDAVYILPNQTTPGSPVRLQRDRELRSAMPSKLFFGEVHSDTWRRWENEVRTNLRMVSTVIEQSE